MSIILKWSGQWNFLRQDSLLVTDSIVGHWRWSWSLWELSQPAWIGWIGLGEEEYWKKSQLHQVIAPHLHHSLATLLLFLFLHADPLQKPSLDSVAAGERAGGAGGLRHEQGVGRGGEIVVGAGLLRVVAAQTVGGGHQGGVQAGEGKAHVARAAAPLDVHHQLRLNLRRRGHRVAAHLKQF